MGLPTISIAFKAAASTAVKRGERGVVALVLKDTVHNNVALTIGAESDIPADFSTANKSYIQLALIGGVNPPKKIIVYTEAAAASDYSLSQAYLETVKYDYGAIPGILDAAVAAFATWAKAQRDSKGRRCKWILPDNVGDHEGIINLVTAVIKDATTTYDNHVYAARVAGLLAGTPLTMSATFQVLPELIDVTRLTNSEIDTLINAGKFVIFHDGEKIKVARAVNSLTTTTSPKSTDFQKIKIMDIMDMIYDDIKKTAEDNYVGKVSNSYDNKMVLVSAIQTYFDSLEAAGILEKGTSIIGIDVAAQKTYLDSVGVDTSEMTDQEIKEANTADKVYLTATITILDAMEDITLDITI